MATQIKKYTKKDGSTAYMFKKYLGVDPLTGKQKETTRRGFSSIKEAKLALLRLDVEIAEGGINKRSTNRSYQEVFDDWFELVYKQKVKESTYWNTRIAFDKHVLPAFGSYKIKKSQSLLVKNKRTNGRLSILIDTNGTLIMLV